MIQATRTRELDSIVARPEQTRVHHRRWTLVDPIVCGMNIDGCFRVYELTSFAGAARAPSLIGATPWPAGAPAALRRIGGDNCPFGVPGHIGYTRPPTSTRSTSPYGLVKHAHTARHELRQHGECLVCPVPGDAHCVFAHPRLDFALYARGEPGRPQLAQGSQPPVPRWFSGASPQWQRAYSRFTGSATSPAGPFLSRRW